MAETDKPALAPFHWERFMTTNQNSNVPPGWVGGFAASNPAFAYPTPDLMALKMLGNMDNIPRLRRQQKVLWPEFSWETVLGKPASRCFQMFAPDISRLGYDDTGRVWSVLSKVFANLQ